MKWNAALLAALAVACDSRPSPSPEPTPSVAASTPAPASSSPSSRAVEMLDRLDTRAPLPLLPMMANHQKQNMREHLAAVQAIVAASAERDFVSIERASSRIGYSEQMGQMCTHMGAGAPGFTEQALAFHHAADTIGEAARRHDLPAVLTALGTTLSACTGCHSTFKQHVVTELASAPAARTGDGL